MEQKYTYTYDRFLDTFFVKDVSTDEILLKCHNELVAVTFIHDVLVGNIDINKFDELPLDMTERV